MGQIFLQMTTGENLSKYMNGTFAPGFAISTKHVQPILSLSIQGKSVGNNKKQEDIDKLFCQSRCIGFVLRPLNKFFFRPMSPFGLIGKCNSALCHKLGQISQIV